MKRLPAHLGAGQALPPDAAFQIAAQGCSLRPLSNHSSAPRKPEPGSPERGAPARAGSPRRVWGSWQGSDLKTLCFPDKQSSTCGRGDSGPGLRPQAQR